MEKEHFVKKIFSSIAPRYDRANSLLTFGMDALWRKKLVRLSRVSEGMKVLDCATGTGRLAFCFAEKLKKNGQVFAVDFCEEMLKHIPKKNHKVHFQKADIMELPFEDNTFDVVSIAWGLRNLSDIKKGLKEMARAAKPGGFLMILETGDEFHPLISPILHFYFKKIVPCLGGFITGQKEAYEYLFRSSLKFPSRGGLIEILRETKCFKKIICVPLLGGASFIYKLEVL